jgi:hypothetical protein
LSEGQTAAGVDVGAAEEVRENISAGPAPAQVEASPLG